MYNNTVNRIKYLRERGVVIEFPEDRKKTIEPSDLIDIVIVKIPCEETEPYSEVRVKISRTLQLDGGIYININCLILHVLLSTKML